MSIKSKPKLSTKMLTAISLITAITCVLAPLSIPIPFSPVPITFITLVLPISVYLLGPKYALISYLLYLCLGFVGLPVFSGFTGGVGKLLGPTGGYLVGLSLLIIISGFFIMRYKNSLSMQALGLILGSLANYFFGTCWLALQLELPFVDAALIGVLPYLIPDGIKIVLVLIIGPRIQARLSRFL